jgi:hypothetical protein
MFSYDPINEYVFAAALSGCVAGAIGAQPVTSSSEDVYAETSLTAFAFAQEFDTLWSTASLDVIQQAAILDMCTAYWYGRIPQTTTPAEYEDLCEALIAAVNETDATAIAGGATPPAYPPSPTLPVGAFGYVIYRPGGVASSTVATTFAQLQTAVTAGATIIYVDSSLETTTIPAGETLTPATGGTIRLFAWNGIIPGGAGSDALTIADTGKIASLFLIDEVTVTATCLTEPALTYPNGTSALLIVDNGATFQLAAGATVPAFTVPNGFELQVDMRSNGFITGVTGVPCFEAASGGELFAIAVVGSFVTATSFGGAVGGIFVFRNDASVTPAAWSINAGTYLPLPYDNSVNMSYVAATVANWSGTNPTSVANALDRIAAKIEPIP